MRKRAPPGSSCSTIVPPVAGSKNRDGSAGSFTGVGSVEPAAAVVIVHLARAVLVGVGPVRELPFLDAPEDLVELLVAHQERVVERLDAVVTGGEEVDRR